MISVEAGPLIRNSGTYAAVSRTDLIIVAATGNVFCDDITTMLRLLAVDSANDAPLSKHPLETAAVWRRLNPAPMTSVQI